MKKVFIVVAVYLVIVALCVVAFNKFVAAEVPIKYNSRMCKMEIFTTDDEEYRKVRTAKEIIKQDIMDFCKDKYIYNVEVATDKGKTIYVIIYNDKGE